MQALGDVAYADLSGPAQTTLSKFEIYDGADWINLCALMPPDAPLFGWPHRKRIDLPMPDANLEDFPVKVPIIADAEIGAKCLATGYDIRFTAADGVTLLPYERESFSVVGGEATGIFWVKTDVATAGTYIWCYYGNASAADGENAEAVWDANFKAVYHMKDATTSTILDSTVNANNGTKKGANEPIEAAGKIGMGQDFDGTDDVITSAANLGLSGDAEFTVGIWVNAPAWYYDYDTAFSIQSFSGSAGISVTFYGGRPALDFYINRFRADDALSTGAWHHIVVTKTPGTITAHSAVYVDGAPVFGALEGNDAAPNIVDAKIEIGRLQLDGFCLDAALDEVRAASVARSAEWIAYEYANMNPADGGLTWGEEEAFPKSYLKSLSLQLGGAGMSPDPIAGQWSAEIFNEDGIFHPLHPTSPYSNYFRVGRKVRISYGATYGGTDYYWQRLIGYMDAPTFNSSDQTASIGGGDYMTALVETALYSPNNYWGTTATFSSVETTKTFGAEMYVEDDALLCQPPGDDLDVAPVGWSTLHGTFISEAEAGGGSDFVGQLETSGDYGWTSSTKSVGSIVNGKVYEVAFKYKKQTPSPYDAGALLTLSLHNSSTNEIVAQADGLAATAWTTVKFHFTAPYSCNTYLKFLISPTLIDTPPYITVYWIDQLNYREVTARVNTRYPMPAACNGVYFVTLDGEPLWYGDNNRGWFYDDANMVFYMDDNVWVETGTNNLVIYYFTTQDIINVLGDVLAASPLYADRAAALAALDYIDPGVTIDKAWFDSGTACVGAIQKICERCGYRFWFAYDGTPTFLPAPTLDDPIVSLEARHEDGLSTLQDLGEIRNNVVIEGIEQGAFSTAKDKDTSRLKSAAASDAGSIATYLERTHVTVNHLFQDQASLDAAAAAMLAAFKDPKWYATLDAPHNPIPLELGDTVGWETVLSPTLKVEAKGIIRDASLSDEGFNYKVEMESGLMNISNYTTTPVTVSTEQCKGWVLTNAGATAGVHFDLPAAVVGMHIMFFNRAAYTITVDPNGTERIAVLTDTAGDYLRSDAAIGSCIKLACLVAGYWHKIGVAVGTWTEE